MTDFRTETGNIQNEPVVPAMQIKSKEVLLKFMRKCQRAQEPTRRCYIGPWMKHLRKRINFKKKREREK